MLGYPTISNGRSISVNSHLHARKLGAVRCFLSILTFFCFGNVTAPLANAQQGRKPSAKGGVAELSSAGPQRRQGSVFMADDSVDLRYGDQRLRADHLEYNEQTNEAYAKGHVQYDYDNEHLEGDEAHYNVGTGHGTFVKVRGTLKVERRPNPSVLVTDNPIYFEAQEVEKFGTNLFVIRNAWITVCDPQHPKWQFYAPHARVRVGKTMALVNANFRLFRVPLIWLPYANTPAGPKIRQSGFMVPVAGNSTAKGFVFGDAFYWAPVSWMDATVGAEYLSRRGSAERAQFRIKPWENTSIKYAYYGVIDREHQGGHEQQLEAVSLMPHNWRFVADVNGLSSLTFRLAFADTFGEAINSEVHSQIFVSHNFNGFSLNLASLSTRSFVSVNPQETVTLRNSPQVRFSSVEQRPWQHLPAYFGFEVFAGAVHRDDNQIETPNMVSRTEFAPRVTVPFHFGPWLSATSTAAFRTTYYGDSLVPGSGATSPPVLSNRSITRNDGEFRLDFRLPMLERYFGGRPLKTTQTITRFKHTIEPQVTYRYITGIDDFPQFIRFDADATLSNTNEIEYGITQRFWMKSGENQPQELISWRLVQKRFFDPTFGGAIVNGQRNVLETFQSVSPFAFAVGPRTSSPIVSDFKITPAGRFDTEHLLEYDTQLRKVIAIGTLVKIKPYREFFATVAHFRLQDNTILQPLANQVRLLMGYGSETRRGFNIITGLSYDITNSSLQSQLVQLSYNGKCCGLAVEYRRIALAQVRTDNQFRVAFIVANIGTFGNLRRHERIF